MSIGVSVLICYTPQIKKFKIKFSKKKKKKKEKIIKKKIEEKQV